MQETWVRSMGQEDPLEKEMAIHSSILAWRIPWTEEPGSYSPWGCKESDTTEQRTHTQEGKGREMWIRHRFEKKKKKRQKVRKHMKARLK